MFCQLDLKKLAIDNTLIISGGQQGIDLTFKTFVNKGDVVLVEDPTYLASLHILKTYEGVPVGVKSGENGLDIAVVCTSVACLPIVIFLITSFAPMAMPVRNPGAKVLLKDVI